MGKIYYNGVDYSAPVVSGVSGIKGNAETTYRTGNVNLTPANLGAAPISHAVTATTYGKGTEAIYGHVKLSDTYTSSVGDASSGVAASQKALFDAYSTLNSNISNLIKIKIYTTQTNNYYEYFDAIEGYMPIAVIYGSPSSNNRCTGFNKEDWVDSATGNYVAWFADKIGAGSKYIVIWIKNN